MSGSFIAIIVVVCALCLGGVFFVSSSLERMKHRRQKRLAVASELAQRTKNILEGVPPGYIDQKLKLVLIQEGISNLERVIQLAAEKDSARAALANMKQELDSCKSESSNKKPKPLKKAKEAGEIRKHMMDLFKFIQLLRKHRRIDLRAANAHLNNVKTTFIELGVTVHLIRANQAKGDKNPRLAIYHYHKAMAEYRRGNIKRRFDGHIKELMGLIEEVQIEIKEAEEAAAKLKQEKELEQKSETRVPKEDPRFPKRKSSKSRGFDKEEDPYLSGDAGKKKRIS